MKGFSNLMKLFFVTLAVVTAGHCSFGQGYTFSSSSETFVPLGGGISADNLEQDDHLTGNVDIGFSFNYFGTAYTQLRISSNGVVVFGLDPADNPLLRENTIATSEHLRIIAPLWDDLSGVGGSASYLMTGSAPHRVFTVEWLNWKWNYNSSQRNISFQLQLYETTNAIVFNYRREAGTLNGPDASIGLIGNQVDHFYSLSDDSASPSMSFNGNDGIDVWPLSGQRYQFTPFTVTTPAVQASAIQTIVESESASVNYTIGDGEYRAVFIKQTSSSPDVFTPANGTYYNPSPVFGNTPAGSGWFCVYNGKGNAVAVTNLKSGLPYKIQVIEYNGIGGAQRYLAATTEANPVVVNTPLVTPSGQPSAIQILRVSGNEVTFALNEGSGYKRAIFIRKKTGSDDTAPVPVVDNTFYAADPAFGEGSEVDNSGWYCVFNGTTASTVTVTGLSGASDYRLQAVDYNGTTGSERYNVVVDNITDVHTHYAIAVPAYAFDVTSGTFSPLGSGEALNAIEADNAFSEAVNIGFTFWFGGVPFTELKASSDGFITFNKYATDAAVIDRAHLNNLATSLLRPLIAPLWDDLNGSGGAASYAVTGEAPHRVFTLEYLNWKWSFTATQPGISFQIKLYETTNRVEFVYRDEAGDVQGAAASVGLAFLNRGANNFLSSSSLSASSVASKTTEQQQIAGEAATGLTFGFTPVRFNQSITFSIDEKTYGDPKFRINASVNSDQIVRFTSSDENVARISNDSIVITGAGMATITAYQDGDVNHNAAPPVARTLTVHKADQEISFDPLVEKVYRDEPFSLQAEAGSGLPVIFTSSHPGLVEVVENTVVIKGAGVFEITASQPGDGNYNPAPAVIQPLVIHKAEQVITFVLADKTLGDEPFILEAISDSGLPIVYSSLSEEIVIEGDRVTITQPGTLTVTASQAGDDNFKPASVSRTICIHPARPEVEIVPGNPWPFLLSNSETGNAWFKDDELIVGEGLQSLAPPETGTYAVQVTIDGCTSLRSEAKSVIITASDENIDARVSVYPNPVADQLIIDIPETAKRGYLITIFDLSGKLVRTEHLVEDRAIDVSALAAGLYHLRIQAEKNVSFKLLVKQ